MEPKRSNPKVRRLIILAVVLAAVCAAALLVSRYQQKLEDIEATGEIVLEIPTDDITAIAWENETGSYSFTKSESWQYDDDEAFPVDEERLLALAEQFAAFGAAFTIEDPESLSDYGLDEPVCTISITAGDRDYNILLGDYSTMDQQRYLSIGDGNVYLATNDPMDEFDAELPEVILNDTLPEYDTLTSVTFTGAVEYSFSRQEDMTSLCAEDVYFYGDEPLDTDRVEDYSDILKNLDLTDYATYNATEQELPELGLSEPELTIAAECTVDDDGTESSFTLSLGQNAAELEAYNEAVENGDEELPSVTCYARVGESKIVYIVSQGVYNNLLKASYDDLRHDDIFTGDFTQVTEIAVTLDGEKYILSSETGEDEELLWYYNDAEADLSRLESAIAGLSAESFTVGDSGDKEEISFTLTLNNDDYPEVEIALYRYDGQSCIAEVDGSPVALVPRAEVTELAEAVYEIVLEQAIE